MEINNQLLSTLIKATDFNPEQMGASFWYEAYRKQKQENQELKVKVLQWSRRIRTGERKTQ